MRSFFSENWFERLKAAGLGTTAGLLHFSDGTCVSRHARGATWRVELPGEPAQVIFVKQDFYTSPSRILWRLLKFRLPETNTEREARLLENARRLGFRVPEVIARTQHSPWLLPGRGAMVEVAVKGRAVDDIARDPAVPESEKRAALDKARATLKRLQDAQIDWDRDCKPEHFFLCDDGEIALIDGERLFPVKAPLTAEYRAAQYRRFDSFLPPEYRS